MGAEHLLPGQRRNPASTGEKAWSWRMYSNPEKCISKYKRLATIAYILCTHITRPYDRNLVSNIFTIESNDIRKNSRVCARGMVIVKCYITTGIENVPIFIKSVPTHNTDGSTIFFLSIS